MDDMTGAQVLELTRKPGNLSADPIVFFDGVGFGTSVGLLSKLTGALQGQGLALDMQGEWLAVIREPEATVVHTDGFGFNHLFYTTPELNGAGIAAASASFEALVAYLRDRGCPPSADIAYALPLIASTGSFFNQGYSPRTSCVQIKRLLPGETIRVTAEGCSVVPNAKWSEQSDADYHDLIDIGISKVRHQLASLNADGVHQKELYLSGGKDSRTCLSLMLARRSRDFTCTTHGTGGKRGLVSEVLVRDFAISSQLVSHYNLRWSEPVEKQTEWKTFAECLADYRRFRSNKYYSFSPSNFHTQSKNDRIHMEIHGGCGEALRGYWAKYFRNLPISARFKVSRGNVWHDAAIIFQSLVQRQSMPEELYSLALREFVVDMREVPGNTIYEVLDNHYILHRNRYHFGNVRQAYEAGKLLYYPLAQKEFLLASQKIPHASRCQGKLLYDIIEQSTPSAHLFPYESGFFECAQPPKAHIPVTEQALREVSEEHQATQEAQRLQSRDLYAAGRNYDIPTAMNELARTNLEKIMDGSKELRAVYEGQQVGRNSKALAASTRNHYIARLDGIAQVFDPQQAYEIIAI